MLTHLAELVVRVADLMEAEGRDLRRVVGRIGVGMSFSLLASGLLLGGCSLLLAGLWIMLEHRIGAGSASALTGVLAIGLGIGAIAIAQRYHR